MMYVLFKHTLRREQTRLHSVLCGTELTLYSTLDRQATVHWFLLRLTSDLFSLCFQIMKKCQRDHIFTATITVRMDLHSHITTTMY